jgi:hypothetical protein
MNHKYAKWIFGILSLSFILKFYFDENLWRSFREFPRLNSGCFLLFIPIFLLIPINWFLEGLKWRIFLPESKRPDHFLTLKIIFAGVSCAILTPNRMGDFIGRGLVSPVEIREETVLATFMGNFCQFFVLLILGIPALFHLFPLLVTYGNRQMDFPGQLLVLWSVLCISFLISYPLIFTRLGKWAQKWSLTAPWTEKFLTLSKIPLSNFILGISIALLRYLVFSFQYYLVLILWGVQLNIYELYIGLAGLYLFQTIIPLPPFYSLIVRGEASILIWGIWAVPPVTAMTASYLLFFFNLFIPACIGFFFLMPWKAQKK